ncbi:MAG TPA: ATP-binding cassette domain-containing protein [Parasegetibacter sp.]
MLKTESIRFKYNEKREFSFPDIYCEKGNELLIKGPSGTGKTTLLHLLGGLLPPDSGRIIIGDKDISHLKGARLDAYRGKHVGIVFQRSHFLSALTVKENLEARCVFAGIKPNESSIMELLEELEIASHANVLPHTMSQGQQQRLSIARAIVHQPELILADEPTSSLDDKNCEIVSNLLMRQSQRAGAALVVVSHDNRLHSIFNQTITLS